MFLGNDIASGPDFKERISAWHCGTKFHADCPLVTYLYKKMYGWIDRSNQEFDLLYTFYNVAKRKGRYCKYTN